MNAIEIIKYRCGECGKLHLNRDDAYNCCQPSIYACSFWKCSECGDECDDEDKARLCCLDGETPLIPTPIELEAAGQTRLNI